MRKQAAQHETGGQWGRWRGGSAWWRVVVIWAVMTAAGVVLHRAVWVVPSENPGEGIGQGYVVKSLSNANQVLCAPGWFLARRLSGSWRAVTSVPVSIGVHGVMFAGYVVAGALVWRVRRVLSRGSDGVRCAADEGTPASKASAARERGAAHCSRRRFVVDAVLGSGAVVGSGAAAWATGGEAWRLRRVEHELVIADLPGEAEEFRIAHVSDTHYGPRVPASHVREAVKMALGMEPDLVVLTGDYILNGSAFIEPAVELLRPLVNADGRGMGVIAVRGNHDWYADGHAVGRALRNAGIRVIDNQRVYVDLRARAIVESAPAHGAGMCVAGIGDMREAICEPRLAMLGREDRMPTVLLSHRPDAAEEPSFLEAWRRYRVDVMLSGHTHGGQVRLPIVGAPVVPSAYGQKYARGLCEGPLFPVVVSAGVGMSILPVRWGVPPEVGLITLRRGGTEEGRKA